MKRMMLMMLLTAIGAWSMGAKAQEEVDKKSQPLLQRWSVGVSASTMGVGVDVSTTLNRYFMLRAGVDMMPGITFKTDVDVECQTQAGGTFEDEVSLKGGLQRTQCNLLLNVYPIRFSSFFITGGFYAGGDKLVEIKGTSEKLKDLYTQYGSQAGVVIGDYKLPIKADGSVGGGIKVSNFRPYLGIGFGRIVPRNRIGFLWELGVQFHGTPEVYSTAGDLKKLTEKVGGDDEFSDILDKLNVYPVLKFRFCGRIF